MKQNLCIIGYGRLGETLADILKDYFDISILDSNTQRADLAASKGFSVISKPDLSSIYAIILCVPISKFETTIETIKPHIAADAVVMDTCSVKVMPARVMTEELPDSIQIIATHPLFGPDSINRGLSSLSIVTYPVQANSETFAAWDKLWSQTGLNVINTTPEEHDKTTAYTLGMTHFFGRIMGELELEPQALTTVGYNALYEVMMQTNSDTWQLFYDMQRFNPYAQDMRSRVYAAIQAVEAKLDEAIL